MTIKSDEIIHSCEHVAEGAPPCTGCAETYEVVDQTHEKTSGLAEVVKSRIIGYHFGGLHYWPGRDGVAGVYVGDPGIPGMMSIKIVYKGTGKRNSIFTVPVALMVIEEEELPIIIASKIEGIHGV